MKQTSESAYPLAWPDAWPRTPPGKRGQAAFKNFGARIPATIAMRRLEDSLHRLGARETIFSSNLPRRMDGSPRFDGGDPQDIGIAVYFTLKKTRTVLACDRWNRVADNIAALAAHIEAIRAIDRYGVGTIEQAFRGYAALPSPDDFNWKSLLAWTDGTPAATLEQAEYVYKQRIKVCHPDGGSSPDGDLTARLTAAIAAARKELGAGASA